MCENTPTNQGWTYRNRIQQDAAGETVLQFYLRRYPHSSREAWRNRIVSGDVRLDDRPTTPETRLLAGQRLTYRRRPWREPDTPRSYALLYEDEHIIAVAKPAGLPVLPGGQHLRNTLLARVRERYPETPGPAPLHRLGRGTSGVVLFACTELARRVLSEDFRNRRVRKIYRALVAGADMPDRFAVDVPIGRIPYAPTRYLYAATSDGKPARTECRVLNRIPDGNRSLIRVNLVTGRAHQIRIHLAAAGHPLIDDPLYRAGGRPAVPTAGDRAPLPGDVGYHLHAHELHFTHPATGRKIHLTCPPPPILRTPAEEAGSSTPRAIP
ncbi:MAG: RluA family pseudouridine synthase [Gemmatimonadota bacterium]|nr:RluA family pseudouridine synthase [Gemmatimonadota bacterium]